MKKSKRLPKHKEQYDRMTRWYNKLQKICDEKGFINSNIEPFYFDDIFYAFFINCYHLKDWIENDSSIKDGKNKIKKFSNEFNYLEICHDICLGAKHLKINCGASLKSSKTELLKRALVNNLYGPSATYIDSWCEINIDGEEHNAFDVATKCVEEWNKFFKKNNLSIKQNNMVHFN